MAKLSVIPVASFVLMSVFPIIFYYNEPEPNASERSVSSSIQESHFRIITARSILSQILFTVPTLRSAQVLELVSAQLQLIMVAMPI